MPSHRYVRAYLAGSSLPTLVVAAAGLIAVAIFDRLESPVQRALLLPTATNPAIWGFWNVLWVALGPRWRVQIGWHGVMLALLLISVGVLLAGPLNVSEITPQRAGAVLIPPALPITFSGGTESPS
jgi:hypothetical protein